MKGLLATAFQAEQFMSRQGWSFCLIGGIALQRWGEPRLTIDIDITLLTGFGNEQEFISKLCDRFNPRRPDAQAFALASRVLLLKSFDGTPIDVALAGFPYEEQVVHRASKFDYGDDVILTTCSAEDLVILKAFADRPQDWVDIENILIRQGARLDRGFILPPLAALAELKEAPEIVDRLRQLFDKIT